MNNCIYMIKLLAIAILGILTSACLIEPIQLDSKAVIKGAPEWVNRGSTALSTKEGRIFYGVSKAAPAGDLGLQKSIADDGSVDEIARLLSSYLVEVAGGYRDSDGLGTDQVGDENLSQEVNGTALQRAKYSVEQQVDDAISRQLKDAVAPEHKVETTRLIKEAATSSSASVSMAASSARWNLRKSIFSRVSTPFRLTSVPSAFCSEPWLSLAYTSCATSLISIGVADIRGTVPSPPWSLPL